MKPKKPLKQIRSDFVNRRKKLNLPCTIKDCNGIRIFHKKYCERHAQQMLLYGYIRKRTMSDPNVFEIRGSITKIFLYDGNAKPIATVIIDTEDYDKVKDRKWSYNQFSGQVYSRVPTYVSLKRTLLNIESYRRVVFKNEDKKDFRKHNLHVQPISHMKGRGNAT